MGKKKPTQESIKQFEETALPIADIIRDSIKELNGADFEIAYELIKNSTVIELTFHNKKAYKKIHEYMESLACAHCVETENEVN